MQARPLYPEIRIELRSRNHFALVSAVRSALRRRRVAPGVIDSFTERALDVGDPGRAREVCRRWVTVCDAAEHPDR